MQQRPVLFVSLGPGEPELITLKGLKALQKADYIFCPATGTREGKQVSRATDILRTLDISEASIHPFELPMNKDREKAFAAYDEVYEATKELYQQGQQVAIVAEGDSGFYSSIQYIYDKLQLQGIAVQRIAGIPAFIAAGAVAGLHIVRQEERMIVIPGIITTEELHNYLAQQIVVVIMKLSQCTEEVHHCIRLYPEYSYHYFENVGTEREYYSCTISELQNKKYPYFSLLIIRPQEKQETFIP